MKTNVEKYLKEHENKELCRFITCGSVDDGKSTLIGRMLYDSKMLFEDQILSLEKDSKKLGNAGEKLDFALLVDGLASEREQGITIDVAYRFFTSEKRKFIIADTPGHEQYTRNMATGASTADIAIILIDARKKGVLTQTKRHSYIASLLGIKQFIIAVNKMDLIDYNQEIFNTICKNYQEILPCLKNHERIKTHFVPICALDGDNIASKSINMPWYDGKTLSELLDTLPIVTNLSDEFIMSVQYVNRPHLNFRGFCGNIASGSINVKDEVVILPSLKTSKVKQIITPSIKNLNVSDKNEKNQSAKTSFPSAITLTLEDEIDISRGDVMASKNHSIEISNSFKAMVIWMSEERFSLSGSYLIKIANLTTSITFEKIDYKKDINTFEEFQSDELKLNDIAKCTLRLSKKTALAAYKDNKTLGSFIIIDKYSNETLAAGMVEEILASEEKSRIYTQAEIELNAYIRKNYPEWECKKI
ncbi:sulfate adenylyltransferase subunit CysN [Campylobacter coli]|uniref:sulfate adenylyltransferase subunit CysN n=1 Tax=Campylobacter coli TaxID=195 RepID=UPI00139DC0BA|nr:sulfate adenylyltransferase subunit CysN [Campylobacter coli]ELK4419633.1 sulfate adenylyltransferase subunit CysN [Campylobacter coli]ELK4482336.1 sulfate adenylyltransferase subunit CysN [Campylobacter coli]NHL31050.1 sulfate adenylyltransferase subunit CysN [Campylobacter coli]